MGANCHFDHRLVLHHDRPDSVEKVAFLAKRRVRIETAEQNRRTSCHRHLPGDADLGELAQVLSGSSEVKLVSGTIGAT